MWDRIGAVLAVWDRMGPCGTRCYFMELSGPSLDSRNRLGCAETVWDHLGPSGTVWGRLGPSGTVWDWD
eukprot:2403131-Alexandrium_andersonii.AAC.1